MAEETASLDAMQHLAEALSPGRNASIHRHNPLCCLFSQTSGGNAALSLSTRVQYVPEDRTLIESGAGFNERIMALLTQAMAQGVPYEQLVVAHPSAFQRCQRGEGLRCLFPRETQLWVIPACVSDCWSLVIVLHVDMDEEHGVVIYVADPTPANWNLHRSRAGSVVEKALMRDSVRVFERHVLDIPHYSSMTESGLIACNAFLELVNVVSSSSRDQLHVRIPACFKSDMAVKLKRGGLCELFKLAPSSVWHEPCGNERIRGDRRHLIMRLLNNPEQEIGIVNDSITAAVLLSHGKRFNRAELNEQSLKRCRLGEEDSALSSAQLHNEPMESIKKLIGRSKGLVAPHEIHGAREVCSQLLLVSTRNLLDDVENACDLVLQQTSEEEKPEQMRWCAEFLANALYWLPKEDELKLSDMIDRCQPSEEDVVSQEARVKHFMALNQRNYGHHDLQECCDRSKTVVASITMAISLHLERVSSFRRAITEAHAYINATDDGQRKFVSRCTDLAARCRKDIETNELLAAEIKHSSSIRLRMLIKNRQEELRTNGNTADSAAFQANQEVFESTDPDVVALREERLSGETKLTHLQRTLQKLRSDLSLFTAMEGLSKSLQAQRDRIHENLICAAEMTLAKIKLDSTTAVLRHVPELRRELLNYFTNQSIQQKNAETAQHELEHVLAEHEECFGDAAPLKRNDIVEQMRVSSETASRSAQTAMQMAEDQEYLWRDKHSMLSTEVQRALLAAFENLANRVDPPVKQRLEKIMNAWVEPNTADTAELETTMDADQEEGQFPAKRESCVVM